MVLKCTPRVRVVRLVSEGTIYGIPAFSAMTLQKICMEPRWGKVTFIHVYPLLFSLLRGAPDSDSLFFSFHAASAISP